MVYENSQVEFDGGVTFQMAAEADIDIVEVKLNYRNANDGPWIYTYLTLEPSTRVEANFTLGTSMGYIPPGSALEYFYTVRDAHNNTIQSEAQTIIYTDPRFDWQTTIVGALSLMWHDQPLERVEAIGDQLRISIEKVEGLLETRLKAHTRGVIYNTRDEADQAFPSLSATIDDRQIFHGFAFTDWNVFTGVGLNPRLITHEVAHLLLHQTVNSHQSRVPAWIDEGFSSYVEPGGSRVGSTIVAGHRSTMMPLRFMGSVPGKPSDVGFFYLKAESVVGYLIETYGDDNFRALLEGLNKGQTVDAALLETYGFDQDGLEQSWVGSFTGQTSGGNADGSFVNITSIILGGLVLLAVTLTLVKFLLKKLVYRTNLSDERN